MDGIEEAVTGSAAEPQVEFPQDGDFVDPFDAAISKITRDEPESDSEPDTGESPTEEADGREEESQPEKDADPEAGKPDTEPKGKRKKPDDDDVDPQEADLRKEEDGRMTIEERKFKALLTLKNRVKDALLGDSEERATVKTIREAVEQFAPIIGAAREAGIGSEDDLKEAIEAADQYKRAVVEFRSEDRRDVANFLHNWRSADEEAFDRMVGVLPEYLRHVAPDSFVAMVDGFPDLIGQLPDAARKSLEKRIAENQVSYLEGKLRAHLADASLSKEQKDTLSQYYVLTIQTLEYESGAAARSPEQIAGGAPKVEAPDPRDEEIRKLHEQREAASHESVERWFSGVRNAAMEDIRQKAREATDSLLKPFAESLDDLSADGVKEKVYAGIWAAAQKYFSRDLQMLDQAREGLKRYRSNEAELRSKYSTLVEEHGKIMSRARDRFKNSNEFADLRKKLVTRNRPEVEKREAAQEKRTPVASSNSQAVRPARDLRKAQTTDELFDMVFNTAD